jgi:hypothetical protein
MMGMAVHRRKDGRQEGPMFTLKIEHPIHDFETWNAAFARDPLGRRQAGVRRHRVFRPTGDRHQVMIDLDFDQEGQARAFLEALREVWRRAELSPALPRGGGAVTPRAIIVEVVASEEY